jgi:hypothetical protein
VVPGYGLADVVPQALGGWFGFEFYGVLQTATQNYLAHMAPSLAMIGKDLARTTPGRPKAPTGGPVFLHGSAASDDVHAILQAVPGITRVVGHSKGALAIENALRDLDEARRRDFGADLRLRDLGDPSQELCAISRRDRRPRVFELGRTFAGIPAVLPPQHQHLYPVQHDGRRQRARDGRRTTGRDPRHLLMTLPTP